MSLVFIIRLYNSSSQKKTSHFVIIVIPAKMWYNNYVFISIFYSLRMHHEKQKLYIHTEFSK